MPTPPPRRGRPPVSSLHELEEVAFALLLRDGYEATTVPAIMAAAGVGRSTFFRYVGSKSGIVWGEFDRAVDRLKDRLDVADDAPVMATVVDAVVESTRLSREAAPETWLDRFRVLDTDPALIGETAAHWRVWAAEVAAFAERRSGLPSGSPVAAAVGGAIQAAYVAVLRQWSAARREIDITTLHEALEPIGSSLQRLLDES